MSLFKQRSSLLFVLPHIFPSLSVVIPRSHVFVPCNEHSSDESTRRTRKMKNKSKARVVHETDRIGLEFVLVILCRSEGKRTKGKLYFTLIVNLILHCLLILSHFLIDKFMCFFFFFFSFTMCQDTLEARK